MGSDNAARLGAAMDATRQAQAGAQFQAQGGAPMVTAIVVAIADTGQLINFDPVVDLTVALETGEQVRLRTLVSKLQVPRQGDGVLLAQDPQHPGGYLYAGPAGNGGGPAGPFQ